MSTGETCVEEKNIWGDILIYDEAYLSHKIYFTKQLKK